MCLAPTERFLALTMAQQKAVEIRLCRHALKNWESYCAQQNPEQQPLTYFDTVVGMIHQVEVDLPRKALAEVEQEQVQSKLYSAYNEPIVALQDQDWELPEYAEYAYYALYNLWRKYMLKQRLDPLLILNQALASIQDSRFWLPLLEAILTETA